MSIPFGLFPDPMQGLQGFQLPRWADCDTANEDGELPDFMEVLWEPDYDYEWSNEAHENGVTIRTSFLAVFEKKFLLKIFYNWQRLWWKKLAPSEKYKHIRAFARMWWHMRQQRIFKGKACKYREHCDFGPLNCQYDHSAQIFDPPVVENTTEDTQNLLDKPIYVANEEKKEQCESKAGTSVITRGDVILFLWNEALIVASPQDPFQFLEIITPPPKDEGMTKARYFEYVEQLWIGGMSIDDRDHVLRRNALVQTRNRRAQQGSSKVKKTRKQTAEAKRKFQQAKRTAKARHDELLGLIGTPRPGMLSVNIVAARHCGLSWESKAIKRPRDEDETEMPAPAAKKPNVESKAVEPDEDKSEVPATEAKKPDLEVKIGKRSRNGNDSEVPPLAVKELSSNNKAGKRSREEDETEVPAPAAKKLNLGQSTAAPLESLSAKPTTPEDLKLATWRENLAKNWVNNGASKPLVQLESRSPPAPPAKVVALLKRAPTYITKSVLGKRKYGVEEVTLDPTKKQKVDESTHCESPPESIKAIKQEVFDTAALSESAQEQQNTAEASPSSPPVGTQEAEGIPTKSAASHKATESVPTGALKPEPASVIREASTPEKVISKTPTPVIGKKRRLSDDEEETITESEAKKPRVGSFSSGEKTSFNTSTNSSRVSTPAPNIFSPPASPVAPVSPASSTSSRQQSPADDMVAAEMIAKSAAEPEEVNNEKSQTQSEHDAAMTEKEATAPTQPAQTSSSGEGKLKPADDNGSEQSPSSPGGGLKKVENAENLDEEDGIVIDYHAAPITKDELGEMNASAKQLMKTANQEDRAKHRNWLVNEVKMRALSEDEDPAWREMVFKRFRIDPELRKPGGD